MFDSNTLGYVVEPGVVSSGQWCHSSSGNTLSIFQGQASSRGRLRNVTERRFEADVPLTFRLLQHHLGRF